MREIGAVRQDGSRGYRRWFQDDYFDLFVWQETRTGAPIAFQLCYDRGKKEGAISWNEAQGFAHARVDSGTQIAIHSMTAILRADGIAPYFRIYDRFLRANADQEPQLHAFVAARLRDYRRLIFGTPRKPRRKGGRSVRQ